MHDHEAAKALSVFWLFADCRRGGLSADAGVLITLSVLIGLMCICASPVLHSIYCLIPRQTNKGTKKERFSNKADADGSCSDPARVGGAVTSKTLGKSPFVFVVKFGTKQRTINFEKLSALEEQENEHEERSATILHSMQPGSFTGVDYLDVENEGLFPDTTPMALSVLRRARSASRAEGLSFHELLVDTHRCVERLNPRLWEFRY